MKKRIFALAGACLLFAACTNPAATPPTGPGVLDEECPRRDGQPCR